MAKQPRETFVKVTTIIVDTNMTFTTIVQRFAKKGEKTGWSYLEVSAAQAEELNPGCRVSFRVKGKLGEMAIKQVALLPMGDGNFILPFNAALRMGTGKEVGDKITVSLAADHAPFIMSGDFMECLEQEPAAQKFFQSLPGSHQRYFSKWIDSAKTMETKARRIAQALDGLSRGWGYGEMIRANQAKGDKKR